MASVNGTIDNIQFLFFLASLMLSLSAQCERNLRRWVSCKFSHGLVPNSFYLGSEYYTIFNFNHNNDFYAGEISCIKLRSTKKQRKIWLRIRLQCQAIVLVLTVLANNKSSFLAELFTGMLFKWKGANKKSHQKWDFIVNLVLWLVKQRVTWPFFWRFLEKDHHEPPRTTTKLPRKTTTNHYEPPRTTMNHQKPTQSLIQNEIWYWILDSDCLNSGSHDIFLRILEKNYYEPPQTTTNHHKPLWTTTNHYEPPQTTTNHYEPPRTTMNHHELLRTTTNHYKPPQTTTNHHKPPQTTTNHHEPLQTTTNHYKPPRTTTNHYEPPRTTTNHYEPLRNITNHHETSQIIMNHHKTSRTITNHHEPPQKIMKHLKLLGNIMNHHEPPWNITNHHKSSPIIMKHRKLSWNIMNHHEPPHVLNKTACFGQYLSEFSMDLHEIFMK